MLGRRGPVAGRVHEPRAEGARRARGRRRRRRSRRPGARSRERGGACRGPFSAPGATSTSCASTPRASPPASRAGCGLRFCVSPVAILGDGKVEAVEIVRNTLVADESGQIRAVATAERETIPCGIVLRSVGYRGVALPGVPFDDERGVIPNREGRVLDGAGASRSRALLRRLDQARPERRHRHQQEGRRRDGRAAARGRRCGPARPGEGDLEALLVDRGLPFVEYTGWEAIDAHERGLGAPPRPARG